MKRAANTEIRRSVVGQMLDYAANAIGRSGWSLERIRSDFATTHPDPDLALQRLLGGNGDAEWFWEAVRTNLSAHRTVDERQDPRGRPGEGEDVASLDQMRRQNSGTGQSRSSTP